MHTANDKRHQAQGQTAAAGLAIALILAIPLFASGQPATQNVEVDPVACWWRTDVMLVRVGQPFSLHLTCSALETDTVRAVVDRSRMGSASVQFPPYEVVSGSQGPDYVTAGRRFMQYQYTLRLIAEDAFGADVLIPGMEISYRIESRVQPDASVQGREQSYQLPPIPMRVASLVANDAQHVREVPVPTFGEIAARDFRGRMFRLVGLLLVAIAILMVAVGLVRWARQGKRGAATVTRSLLPHRTVIAGVRRELQAVERETRGGWTPETVARALSAARIVASYAFGRPVVQRASDQRPADGELILMRRWPSRRRVAVSGPATARESDSVPKADPAAADLDAALVRFTAARYGRAPSLESGSLDEALAAVLGTTNRVAARHTWLAEALGGLRQSLRAWRPRAWAR